MNIPTDLESRINAIWAARVQNRFVYRGMDRRDLHFPFDPAKRPYEDKKELIISFLNVVEAILNAGVEFQILEEHYGNKCYHNPRNLVKWSKRDLEIIGIDCTSVYQNAKEYSDCWQGSQIKQNLKSLSSYLLANRTETSIGEVLNDEKLEIVRDVERWIHTPRKSQPIVLHISRELDIFKKTNIMLPLGSKNQFMKNMLERMSNNEIKPEDHEFYCSICQPINENDIYKMEAI